VPHMILIILFLADGDFQEENGPVDLRRDLDLSESLENDIEETVPDLPAPSSSQLGKCSVIEVVMSTAYDINNTFSCRW